MTTKLSDRTRLFDRLFILVGLLVQVIVYVIAPDNPIALVSGMLGMCSVILTAQGNILTFLFGFGQIITYTYLCYLERFYAGIALNIYYFITQIYGIYAWRRQQRQAAEQTLTDPVPTRRLTPRALIALSVGSLLVSALVGYLLSRYTADSQPYMDAFTTVPSLVAQVLLILVYREQWYLWLFVDALSAIMWLIAGNYCMVALYAFWCINCIYGYIRWTKNLEAEKATPQSNYPTLKDTK